MGQLLIILICVSLRCIMPSSYIMPHQRARAARFLSRHFNVMLNSFILLYDLCVRVCAWVCSRRRKHDKLGSYGGRMCFYQTDGSDAMEVSISGSGCRPTLNSVIFGEAVALLEIARWVCRTNAVN